MGGEGRGREKGGGNWVDEGEEWREDRVWSSGGTIWRWRWTCVVEGREGGGGRETDTQEEERGEGERRRGGEVKFYTRA